MCGIVACTATPNAAQHLMHGLQVLEYRGYDSAGIAVQSPDGLQLRRSAAHKHSLKELRERLEADMPQGTCGIGHTRWATHGGIKIANTHPLTDHADHAAVVHNGIIENHAQLKRELQEGGIAARSETDTEVLVLLISRAMQQGASLEDAFRAALQRVEGSSCFVAISNAQPGTLVGARLGNAGGLVVAHGSDGTTVASDSAAIPARYKQVTHLQEGQMFIAAPDGVRFTDLQGNAMQPEAAPHAIADGETTKGEYDYFMQKEIAEQPAAIMGAMRQRVDLNSGVVTMRPGEIDAAVFKGAERVILAGMGTSLNAAMLGAAYIEQLARLPATAVNASEFLFGDPVLSGRTPVIAVTQSGQSADTLEAMSAAKQAGAPLLVVLENEMSEAARMAHAALPISSGREMSVAATKTMTATVATLLMLAIRIASARGALSTERQAALAAELGTLPAALDRTLEMNAAALPPIAEWLAKSTSRLFYMARTHNYPIAREGALKMKETAYIHAESFAAGEMKHGILALIEEGTPIVAINTADATRKKMLNSISEARARGARIIAVLEEDDSDPQEADEIIRVPSLPPLLSPIAAVVPLQQLAYHTTLALGRDPDRPRNLAKTVTVE